jgi:hypothetical protein
VVVCLPLDPRFVGSNPAEDDGFLGGSKARSHVADLRHVKETYKCQRMCESANSCFFAIFLLLCCYITLLVKTAPVD